MNDAAKTQEVEADAAPPPAPPGPIVIKLSKPIQAHGEMVSELSFREPTGLDIELVGVPVHFTWVAGDNVASDGGVQVVYSKNMGMMLSHLAAVPPSSIKMLAAKDWIKCAMAVQSFFLPD